MRLDAPKHESWRAGKSCGLEPSSTALAGPACPTPVTRMLAIPALEQPPMTLANQDANGFSTRLLQPKSLLLTDHSSVAGRG